MALLAAVESPGSLKLRRWDLPYTESRCSGSSRLSKPHVHPWDRCTLLQRSRIARGASQPPTAQGTTATNLSLFSPEQPGLEDTREVPLGLGSLANGVGDRFYGSLSNKQVGEEIHRLTNLLRGLVGDFTVVKDRVWHLEDDRSLAQEHIERLRASSAEARDNLTVLSDGSTQLAGRMAALERRRSIDRDSLAELEGRLELLDARLGACEEGIVGRMALLDERLVVRESRDAEEDEKRFPPTPAPSPAKGQVQEVVSHDQLQELEAKVELLDARLTVQERSSGPDHTFAMLTVPTAAAAGGTIQFKGEDSVLNFQQIESEASSFQRATSAKEILVADGHHSAAERFRSGEVETVISSGVTGFDGDDEENLAQAGEHLQQHDGLRNDAAALTVAASAAAALNAENNAAVATPFDMHNIVGVWRGCRKPVFSGPSSPRPISAGAGQAACAFVQDALSTPAATVGTEATADAALRVSSTGGASGIRTDQQSPQWPLQVEFVRETSHVSSADQEETEMPQLQRPQQPHEFVTPMPSDTRGRQTCSKGSNAAPEGRVVPGQGLRSPSMSTIGVDSGVVGSGAVCRVSSPKAAPSADFSAVPE